MKPIYENYFKILDGLKYHLECIKPEGNERRVEFFRGVINNLIHDTKIFEINEQLTNLLLNTNNKFYYRNSPCHRYFIDTSISDNKGNTVYGIILADMHIAYQLKDNPNFNIDFSEEDKDYKKIFVLFLVKNDKFNDYSVILREINEKGLEDVNKDDEIRNHPAHDMPVINKAILLVCNFLDFLNNPDVEYKLVERTKKGNLRRIKEGKQPLPSAHLINIKGKLKIYLDKLNSGIKNHYNCQFMVRGHFRVLRSERRYGSKIGMKIWIPPYYKGQGIIVNNNYKLRK